MQYFKLLRPVTSLLASLLVLASFKLAGWSNWAWFFCVVIFLFSGATMVTNDYYDRYHDSKKGKTFVLENETSVLIFTVVLWITNICFTVIACIVSSSWGLLLTTIMVIGVVYSKLLKVAYLPTFLVALASALGVLLALSTITMVLFFGTFILISVREIIKDFQDLNIDAGHKWTLPLYKGERFAQNIVHTLSIFLVPVALVLEGAWGLVPLGFLLLANIHLSRGNPHKAKYLVNIALLAFFFVLFF